MCCILKVIPITFSRAIFKITKTTKLAISLMNKKGSLFSAIGYFHTIALYNRSETQIACGINNKILNR